MERGGDTDPNSGKPRVTGEEAEEPEPTLENGLEVGVNGLAGDKEVSEEAREEEKKEREDDEDEEDGIPEQLTLCLRR